MNNLTGQGAQTGILEAMSVITSRVKKKLYFVVAAYFRFWANLSLRRWKPKIIAVTGSVGKTTMLHLLELQFGERAHYSHFANSAFGISFDIVGTRGITASKSRWLKLFFSVPLRALTFRHKEEFYIVEIDGERPHEAEFLAQWLRPMATLWVSSGRSHAVYFDGLVRSGAFATVEEAIANEFAQLPRHTTELVVIDGDNELMQKETSGLAAKVIGITKSNLKDYQVFPSRSSFTLHSGTFSFDYPLPEETYTQLAMLELLCVHLNVPIRHDMADFTMPPGRSSYLSGIKGVNIIDSSYNAHLISMKSMLNMMQAMKTGSKWLVIGDMTDQGEGEADQHTKLGEAMATVVADRYVLVGRRTAKYTKAALEAAGLADKTVSFLKTTDAKVYLETEMTGQETVLFKGSQYLEWIVEKLLQNPSDVSRLPRQEEAARRRRASWGLK